MKAAMVPNILSGVRIFFAILFPLIPSESRVAVLLLGLLTEFLDGFLARRFHWVTLRGQLLDPIADRIFALSVGLTLMGAQLILPMQLLFVLIRDFVVVFGLIVTVILLKNFDIVGGFKPNLWGKVTTAFQYFVFFDALLFPQPHKQLIWLTGIFSITSASLYSLQFLSKFKRGEHRYGA